jgi:hypothetical protein
MKTPRKRNNRYPMLLITDDKRSFRLSQKESIDLELKLNVSAYAKMWTHIGDVLYKHGSSFQEEYMELAIGKEEYDFLLKLLEKSSWMQCQGVS